MTLPADGIGTTSANGTFASPQLVTSGMFGALTIENGGATAHTLTLAPRRGGATARTAPLPVGCQRVIDPTVWATITLDSADASVSWSLGDARESAAQLSPPAASVQVSNLGPSVRFAPLAGGAPSPATGIWRGYAVAAAAGAVAVGGVILGTAAAAGNAYPFVLGVTQGQTPILENCSVVGGVLEYSS